MAEGAYGEVYGAKLGQDYRLIGLKVPESEVRFQEYYNWTDYIYFYENPDEWEGEEDLHSYLKRTANVQFDRSKVMQAVISRIEPGWVRRVVNIPQTFLDNHCGSGGSNVIRSIESYM